MTSVKTSLTNKVTSAGSRDVNISFAGGGGRVGEDIIQLLAGENNVGTGEKQRVGGVAGAEWTGSSGQWRDLIGLEADVRK